MKDRVTMAEIAQRAGVHVTTVSLALRNHPSLPEKTRERLQKLAKQMGYQPDPALSALVAYRHQARLPKDRAVLAYVTHWHTEWGWQDMPAHRAFFEGAKQKAAQLGYQLEHFWLGEPGLTHRRMSGILVSRGITGLVLASHQRDSEPIRDFDWPRFAGIKIDAPPREPQLHMVTNAQSAIIRLAMQRALEAGYRRIGFVIPRWRDEYVDLAWSAGFLAHQQRLPEAERIPILFYSDTNPSAAARAKGEAMAPPIGEFEAWIEKHEPEVLISQMRFVAPCLAKLGLEVPRDLAFADIFLEQPDGRIAGVRENCERVGEVAIEILVGQLHQNVTGIPPIPTATYVEGTWFDGKSLPPRGSVG